VNLPALVTWTARDVGWGVRSYRLQRSVDGGPWKGVASTTSRSRAQVLTAGHSYRYRVRAVDKAGNVGAWAVGPVLRPVLVADGNAAVGYRGLWTVAADPTARGGALHSTNTAGASATYRFYGRDIEWIARRAPDEGQARVYIDGRYVRTVDLAAAVNDPGRGVFRRHWLAAGTHTIRIVAVGTAGRPTVDVDSFAILR
jgi:hypothetical protein